MVRQRLARWLPDTLTPQHRPQATPRAFRRGSDTRLMPAKEADGTYANIPEFLGTFVLIENSPMELRWRSGTIDVVVEIRRGKWCATRVSGGGGKPIARGRDLHRVLWFTKEYMAYDRTYRRDERGRETQPSNSEGPQDVYETVPHREQKLPFREFLYKYVYQ